MRKVWEALKFIFTQAPTWLVILAAFVTFAAPELAPFLSPFWADYISKLAVQISGLAYLARKLITWRPSQTS